MKLEQGKLYKIIPDKMGFFQKPDGNICELPKDTIVLYLESNMLRGAPHHYFLYDNKIVHREMYRLEQWVTEIPS